MKHSLLLACGLGMLAVRCLETQQQRKPQHWGRSVGRPGENSGEGDLASTAIVSSKKLLFGGGGRHGLRYRGRYPEGLGSRHVYLYFLHQMAPRCPCCLEDSLDSNGKARAISVGIIDGQVVKTIPAGARNSAAFGNSELDTADTDMRLLRRYQPDVER